MIVRHAVIGITWALAFVAWMVFAVRTCSPAHAQGPTGPVIASPNGYTADGSMQFGGPPTAVTVPPWSVWSTGNAPLTVGTGAPGALIICFDGGACKSIADWRQVP